MPDGENLVLGRRRLCDLVEASGAGDVQCSAIGRGENPAGSEGTASDFKRDQAETVLQALFAEKKLKKFFFRAF